MLTKMFIVKTIQLNQTEQYDLARWVPSLYTTIVAFVISINGAFQK